METGAARRVPGLMVAAVLSALLFALASWLFVEHWAFPRLTESLRTFADRGIPVPEPGRYAIVRLCLPYLTIAVAQLAAGIALALPNLRDATIAKQGMIVGLSVFVGSLAALAAFVPPGVSSKLLFLLPTVLVLSLSWLAAWPVSWLLLHSRVR